MKEEVKRESERGGREKIGILLYGVLFGIVIAVMVFFGLGVIPPQPDPPAVQETELAEVLGKIEAVTNRLATMETALGTIHQNQHIMWSNGIVRLRKGQELLLQAQIKAGTLKVQKNPVKQSQEKKDKPDEAGRPTP